MSINTYKKTKYIRSVYSKSEYIVQSKSHRVSVLSLGPAKVNKVKIFSRPCYMIKRLLTFVSGVQGSVLLDFISQNKVKILHKVKTCQNCLHQTFSYKSELICIFFLNF